MLSIMTSKVTDRAALLGALIRVLFGMVDIVVLDAGVPTRRMRCFRDIHDGMGRSGAPSTMMIVTGVKTFLFAL